MEKKSTKKSEPVIKDLAPDADEVKGGTRRADWTVGHVTSVKFPKFDDKN